MQKSSTDSGRPLSFTDLVPGIYSLYSSDDILSQGRRNYYRVYPGFRGRELHFDCAGILKSKEAGMKEGEHFLSWCFFRCIELAMDLGIEHISVSWPPEYRSSLLELWPAATDLFPGLQESANNT